MIDPLSIKPVATEDETIVHRGCGGEVDRWWNSGLYRYRCRRCLVNALRADNPVGDVVLVDLPEGEIADEHPARHSERSPTRRS